MFWIIQLKERINCTREIPKKLFATIARRPSVGPASQILIRFFLARVLYNFPILARHTTQASK